MTEDHNNLIVVGAGRLYLIEPEGGERYLGESSSCGVTVTSEYITVESSDGPVARRLVHKPRSVTRRMDLELLDMTAQNLALFILGKTGSATQGTDKVTDEVIKGPRTGVWYPLGVTADRPEGIWGVEDSDTKKVTVKTKKGAGNASSLARKTDDKANFELCTKSGRIRFFALGTGSPDTALVTYTPLAATPARATSSGAQLREFGLRYIEDATEGTGKRILAPRCTVSPNGQIALKSRTEAQRIPLQVEILEPGSGPALVMYGPE